MLEVMGLGGKQDVIERTMSVLTDIMIGAWYKLYP